jgi:phosphatidate cytidylyltransferase
MLRKRVLSSLVAVPVVVAAVWFDAPLPWFSVLAVFCAVLAVWELYRITGVAAFKPLAVFGVIWTLLFLLVPHCSAASPLPPLLTAAVVLSLLVLLFSPKREGAFAAWAWMLAGVFYIGWLLSHLVALRLTGGAAWLYLAILATFASDTTAYFVGRALGRHKMAPRISPGKTWEGAVGGLAGGVIIALLFTLKTPLQLPIGYGEAVLLGLLVSVFGQLGDLTESLLKRNTGVKESGGMMPGHGGLLDRLDSVLFAGVVVYWYYIYFIA